MNGEDIKLKMAHKVEQGGSVGRAKIGYLNVRKNFEGRLVNSIDLDPERAPLVKWAFETYSSGDHSVLQLQQMLDERGLTTRPSVRFTTTHLRDGAEKAVAYLDLQTESVRHFRGAIDGVKRELLTLFYDELVLRTSDTGINFDPQRTETNPAVRGARDRDSANKKAPRLSARGSHAVSAEAPFVSLGWSKTFLVAGTGFEPATSGL